MENQRLNFIEIVKDIEKGRILLPDFQREFVWREEERQRKIVASVLAKMPIGSILLLKSKPDEYASKYIGCKREVGVENVQKEVEFLLDGQQRMTVLTNVFSNVIHEKCEKVSDLLSPSLKRRFFLRIPKWSKCSEKVCEALDRAMFFFQSRCGIRNIQEMYYSLMIVLAAVIFLKKEWFDDKYVHDKLEAWYWAAIFSGEYDKDQNTKMISHLQSMVKTIQIPRTREKIGWILNLKNNVLECQNFSDESFLLMEKVEEDRYPKLALRGFLCQYLLARTYSDMFLPTRRMSVYSDEAGDYQAHHIVPLGTVKKVGESTVKLRRNAKHICNSPLNFVYITKKENREIADEALSSYIHKICDESKDGIYITAYDKTLTEDGDIKEILRVRYASLKSNIKERIVSLLC